MKCGKSKSRSAYIQLHRTATMEKTNYDKIPLDYLCDVPDDLWQAAIDVL
jgi:hypothetical protein